MLIKVKKEADMFVEEEAFHQGTSHRSAQDEEETLPWTMNASQTLSTQGSVLLYKHCSYPVPNTHKSRQYEKKWIK